MPAIAISRDPLTTLGAALGRESAAVDDAAARIAADGPDVDAIVELEVRGVAYEAIAAAMRSVADTQDRVLDLLA